MEISQAYNFLGLAQGAGEDEIKAAYRTLAQKYNPDLYEAGPLHDDAAARMDELNAAFDTVMTALRMGGTNTGAGAGTSGSQREGTTQGRYGDIRSLINGGNADAALQRLNAIAGGADDAEWNFLVGSSYYYKGWVNDALRYFQTACQLDPTNREYEAALRNLQNSANGNMNGNPYANRAGNNNGGGMGCSCCDMCTAMMCMDMCCGCGRGC